MYDVALSVLACVRAGTDVHVAWIIEDGRSVSTDAVAITPGGGRIGSLHDGALDDAIIGRLRSVGETGGVTEIAIGPLEALTTPYESGDQVKVAIAPGTTIPEAIWEALAERLPVSFTLQTTDGTFSDVHLVHSDEQAELLDGVLCDYSPTPRAVIVGGGPIADSLADAFEVVGWSAVRAAGPGEAGGIAPTLAPLDAIVVMGHDVETSGKSLQAAVSSRAGYIGSLGSLAMQERRRDWLAYRGIEWDPRIHGPAGLPIGAQTPGEIAISIVAEAIAASHIDDSPSP